MTQHGVSERKILLVPYGVDTSAFSPGGTSEGAEPGERLRFVYVGQVALRKGIPILLEAVNGLDVVVDVVGPVFDAAIARSAPRNVNIRGAVGKEELIRIYRSADAFIFPTIEDSFGLVVMEAAATGLPVISTDGAGASELLGPPHVVIEAGRVSALRNALRAQTRLSSDQRREIAEDARSAAARTWREYADEVLDTVSLRAKH